MVIETCSTKRSYQIGFEAFGIGAVPGQADIGQVFPYPPATSSSSSPPYPLHPERAFPTPYKDYSNNYFNFESTDGGRDVMDSAFLYISLESQRLGLEGVHRLCENVYMKHVNPGNCLELLLRAEGIGFERLREHAMRTALAHFDTVWPTYSFQCLGQSQLRELLTDTRLIFEQTDDLLNALLHWCLYEPETRQLAMMDILCEINNRVVNPPSPQLPITAPVRPFVSKVCGCADANNGEFECMLVATNRIGTEMSLRKLIFRHHELVMVDRCPPPKFCMGKRFAACCVDNKVYLSGGDSKSRCVYSYDNVSQDWRKESCMLEGRVMHAMVPFDGKLYTIGGYNERNLRSVCQVDKRNLPRGRWSKAGVHLQAQWPCRSIVFRNKIYVFGRNRGRSHTSNLGQTFDPLNGDITMITSLPEDDATTLVFTNDQAIYLLMRSGNIYQLDEDTLNCNYISSLPKPVNQTTAAFAHGCSAYFITKDTASGEPEVLRLHIATESWTSSGRIHESWLKIHSAHVGHH